MESTVVVAVWSFWMLEWVMMVDGGSGGGGGGDGCGDGGS